MAVMAVARLVGLLGCLLVTMVTAQPAEVKFKMSEKLAKSDNVEKYITLYEKVHAEDLDHHHVDRNNPDREKLQHMHDHLKNKVSGSVLKELKTSMVGMDREVERQDGSWVSKRAINRRGHWPKAIVPWKYHENLTLYNQQEVTRSIGIYERTTCLRFPRHTVDADGRTTNQRLGLGHKGWVKFVPPDGCWSYVGFLGWQGQDCSCCDGSACVHEIGHTLGFPHEDGSPDPARARQIRLSPVNYVSGSTYSHITPVGYDAFSWMHYDNWMTSPPFVDLYPEFANTHGGYFYMMSEANLAYGCQTSSLCAGANITCTNDGYPTVIDGRCQCYCPWMLDPDTGCETPTVASTSTQAWPAGSYALPKTKDGCPKSRMKSGSRVHYSGGGNSASADFMNAMATKVDDARVEEEFCVMEKEKGTDVWPPGLYCIFRVGGKCPEKFSEGFLQFDDDENRRHQSESHGNMPDGIFDNNTRLQTCCRGDSAYWEQLYLPTTKPFALIRNGDYCQFVRGMHHEVVSYTIKSAEEENIAEVGGIYRLLASGIHPKKTNSHTINVCYYTPSNLECGGTFYLTKEKSTYSFNFTKGTDMAHCTWVFKAPKDDKIKLDFDQFDVGCDLSKQILNVRYMRIGQSGFRYCNRNKPQWTIQSLNNTIYVRMFTKKGSSAGFSATVSLVPQSDLCYKGKDQGTSYSGDVDFTRWLEPCIPWKDAVGCRYHPYSTLVGERFSRLEGSYCRNPDARTGDMPWCYTKAEGCRRNYCDPCMEGRMYDKDGDCDNKEANGFCDGTSSHVASKCAKKCRSSLPRPPPRAADVTCPPPPGVVDGDMVEAPQAVYKSGDKVTFRCKTDSKSLKTRVCLTNGQWSEMGFVCSYSCPAGWLFHDNLCYGYSQTSQSREEAISYCKKAGGALFYPKNKELNDFVSTFVLKGRVWLPITDIEKEGEWKWDDGENLNFTSWGEDQPDNWRGREDCAIMDDDGEWNDIPCNKKYPRLCVRQSLAPLCKDFDSKCPEIVAQDPTACTSHTDFAVLKCPKSCNKCQTCPVDPAPANGDVSTQEASVSSYEVVTYSCKDGYLARGDAKRTCLGSDILSGTPLRCLLSCIIPKAGANVNITSNDVGGIVGEGESVKYECDDGWERKLGDKDRKCQADGTLDGNELVCGPPTCVIPGAGSNVIITSSTAGSVINQGELVHYRCKDGWVQMSGDLSRTCQADRTLDGNELVCGPPTCVIPVAGANVIIMSAKAGDVIDNGVLVKSKCKDGYDEESGNENRVCQADGTLSGSELVCVSGCPDGWLPSAWGMCYWDNCWGGKNGCWVTVPQAEAQKLCEEVNATMATARSKQELDKVMEARSHKWQIWLGLRRQYDDNGQKTDIFEWTDTGSELKPTDWSYWSYEEPNNWRDSEDCVEAYPGNQGWNDISCNANRGRPWVCQKPKAAAAAATDAPATRSLTSALEWLLKHLD